MPDGTARALRIHEILGSRAVQRFALQAQAIVAIAGELGPEDLEEMIENLNAIEAGYADGREELKGGA